MQEWAGPSVQAARIGEADTDLRRHAIWQVRLRWASISGQVITILIATNIPDIRSHLTLNWLWVIVAAEVLLNAILELRLRLGFASPRALLVATLVMDLCALTALLYAAGGASNPFAVLYVVHVVLGGVLLGPGWAWILLSISSVLFGSLFFFGPGLETGGLAAIHADHGMMRWHLQGMWIASIVAAALSVYFLGRILAEKSAQEEALRRVREREHRLRMMSSLGTLAAGAAHELATPLSTIAVVSRELERRARNLAAMPKDVIEDLTLLRAEVKRCQWIIDEMVRGAGHVRSGALERVWLGPFLEECLSRCPDPTRIEMDVPPSVAELEIEVPKEALHYAVDALLGNALDVSPSEEAVKLRIRTEGVRLSIEVLDRGPGIPADILPRVTEPFFSTKGSGKRMGLGLFLTDNVIRELGGRFVLESRLGNGTRARIELPLTRTEHGSGE